MEHAYRSTESDAGTPLDANFEDDIAIAGESILCDKAAVTSNIDPGITTSVDINGGCADADGTSNILLELRFMEMTGISNPGMSTISQCWARQ